MEKYLHIIARAAMAPATLWNKLDDEQPLRDRNLLYVGLAYLLPLYAVLAAASLLPGSFEVSGIAITWPFMYLYLGLRSYRRFGTLPYVYVSDEDVVFRPRRVFTCSLRDFGRLWSASVFVFVIAYLLMEENALSIDGPQTLWLAGLKMLSLLLPVLMVFEALRLALHLQLRHKMLVIDVPTR